MGTIINEFSADGETWVSVNNGNSDHEQLQNRRKLLNATWFRVPAVVGCCIKSCFSWLGAKRRVTNAEEYMKGTELGKGKRTVMSTEDFLGVCNTKIWFS